MLETFVKTNCISLDYLLNGGFPTKTVSLVYGEAETGKTSLAIQCAVSCARKGLRSLFIDTDGTFSFERLSQIAKNDFEQISPLIIIMRPTSFQDQSKAIDQLEKVITDKFGLIIVDTITSLYRVELDEMKETYTANRELNRQLAVLTQIARNCGIAVIIISQVRSILFEGTVRTRPVAARVLNYWSDLVLNMIHSDQRRVIKIVLEKHPKIKELGKIFVQIQSSGLIDYKQ